MAGEEVDAVLEGFEADRGPHACEFGRARQDGAQAQAVPCGPKDDAVHDEQVADAVGERFLAVAGELAAGDV